MCYTESQNQKRKFESLDIPGTKRQRIDDQFFNDTNFPLTTVSPFIFENKNSVINPSDICSNVIATVITKNSECCDDQPKPKQLKSCARCRKHKTKCNYIDTIPNPCSSCEKRGLTCQLEIVIPVKRSNIIKNLSSDINELKGLVDELIIKDRYLKSLCLLRGIHVDGLVDVEECHRDEDENLQTIKSERTKSVDVFTPPYSTQLSPSSDVAEEVQVKKSFSLGLNICYSYGQICAIFDGFNKDYLKFLPIIERIESPESLYKSNPFVFWSIIFIMTRNSDIYTDYLVKTIMESLISTDDIDKNESFDYIRGILLLCFFPTRMISTGLDNDDELDTTMFQWLNAAKNICLKLNIEQSMDDTELDQFKRNIWCAIYMLGNFYGFRLGLKWEQPIDFIIEECKEKMTYIGQLLNVSTLMSKLLDHMTYRGGNNANEHLISRSLSNWKFKLNNMKLKLHENDFHLRSALKIAFDFMELLFILFEPDLQRNKKSHIPSIYESCSTLFSSLEKVNISQFPMFTKIALECNCLVLTKLNYSAYNESSLKNSASSIYVKSFNQLLSIIEYNDTKAVLNVIMDFDSSVKIDYTLLQLADMNGFKNQLMQGLLSDLKKAGQKFNSIDISNDRLIQTKKKFSLSNLNFENYVSKFNDFRSNVDLVILYSKELLKLPQAPTLTTSPIANSSQKLSSVSIASVSSLNSTLADMSPDAKLDINDKVHLIEPISMDKGKQQEDFGFFDTLELWPTCN